MSVTWLAADGGERRLDVPIGTTMMDAAVAAGIPGIEGECGGALMCATCHVTVDPAHLDRLPPVSAMEDDMLDMASAPREPSSRLSCQIVAEPALDGLSLSVPGEPA